MIHQSLMFLLTLGATASVVGAGCLFMVGPAGPCGPSSILGGLFFLVGLPLFYLGGLISLVALVLRAITKSTAGLWAALVAGTVVVGLATAYAVALREPGCLDLILPAWPGTAAALAVGFTRTWRPSWGS